MVKEFLVILLSLIVIQAEDRSCPEQFISIGKFCYHFGDVEMNWEEAGGACKGIGSYINETVIPAVLDFGSTRENHLLLKEVYGRSHDYWIGGKKIKSTWKWISEDDVDIDLHASYWGRNQPNIIDQICIKAIKNSDKISIATEKCSEKFRVICQIIPKKYGFRDIGGHKYFFSNKNSIEGLQWEEARNKCQSMVPPQDFDYVDLAILTEDTDQQLLKIISQHGNKVWLGGINDGPKRANGDRLYTWLDGRVIDENSYFWNDWRIGYSPNTKAVVFARVISWENHSRAFLGTTGEQNLNILINWILYAKHTKIIH